jgi:uncharacterized delta-60 repeat protein
MKLLPPPARPNPLFTRASCWAAAALMFVLVIGFAITPTAHATPGDLDPLNVNLGGSNPEATYVLAAAMQPDGKMIIAGGFNSVLGVPRNNIARLNADGTLDSGFDPKANNEVYSVAVQADGKVLLGGFFTTLQPNGAGAATTRNNIARLNADGTLDTGFNPNANGGVSSVVVQADGKVLLGGLFTTLQPNGAAVATARQYIARVNGDGTLDTGFDPKADSGVVSLVVQADGKVVLGGRFTTLQPNGAASATARQNIARVNADGTLDTGFDPKADDSVVSVALQADGKVLLGGQFTTLQPNGAGAATARQYIARVNGDGTLDAGFDPKADDWVYSVVVQTDGKVLLGGIFTALQPNGAGAATTRQGIARVNADGTLDTGFDPKADSFVYCVAMQADGKVLLGGEFTTLQPNGAGAPTARNFFARLVNDPSTQSLTIPSASRVQWLRGGSSPEVAQVTFELSTDGGTSYTTLGAGTRISGGWERTGLSLSGSGHIRARGRVPGGYFNGSGGLVETVASFSVQSAPEIVVLGNSVNITTGDASPALTDHTDFGSLNATSGTLVRTFTITNSGTANLTLGSVTIGGTHAADFTVSLQPSTPVVPNGSTTFQVTFDPSALGLRSATVSFSNNDGDENPFTFDLQGTGSVSGVPGDLDPLDANLVGTYVTATAVQPDGKTIIAGNFSSVLGVPRSNIARFNADGTLDTGFDPKADNIVWNVAVQADGKVLLGGDFTTLQPNGGAVANRNRIARVNQDGTLDAGFDPNANSTVLSMVAQPNGKVLLGGKFTTLQPNGGAVTTRNRIARLNGDGTLDTGFDPSANSHVYSMAVQADGKVLLVGIFTALQPNGGAVTTRSRIARVNADGTLDTGFDPKADSFVYSMALQPDGKVLFGGLFTTLQPNGGAVANRSRIARVNADGTLDTGFDPKADNVVYSLALQADGKVLLGGNFTTLQPNGGAVTSRSRIARVNADGTLDTGFDPKANGIVFCLAVQADGEVLLGGQFTSLQPNGAGAATPRNLFARLDNDAATQSLTIPNASRVQWLRGGASPEVEQVTFELSTDGGANYSTLGAGTRISGGWERSGLTLPSSGQLRARGRTLSGFQNGSGGLVETVASFGGAAAAPIIATGSLKVLGNGVFQFSFTNANNATFDVLATTDVALPTANWTLLGTATNAGGGIYQFTDPDAANLPWRFYQLRGQ